VKDNKLRGLKKSDCPEINASHSSLSTVCRQRANSTYSKATHAHNSVSQYPPFYAKCILTACIIKMGV
jgi:hypothetical protein